MLLLLCCRFATACLEDEVVVVELRVDEELDDRVSARSQRRFGASFDWQRDLHESHTQAWKEAAVGGDASHT
jgi:hypothetical protein